MKEMEARCHLALMGIVQPITTDEVYEMTKFIAEKMLGYKYPLIKDFVEKSIRHYHKHEVKYITAYRVYDMPCICFLLDSNVPEDDENYYPAPFEEDYGTGYPCAFCFVLNLENDWCSEFGDVFFERKKLYGVTYYTKA